MNNLNRMGGENTTSTVYIMGHTPEYKKQLDELIDILINKGKCEVYYHEDGLSGDILELDDKKNLWCVLCVSSALLHLDKSDDKANHYSIQPGIADNLEFAQDDYIPVIPVFMDSVMTGVLSSLFRFEYSTSLLTGKYSWIPNMYNLGKFGYVFRVNAKDAEKCAMLTAFYMSQGMGYQKDKKKAFEIEKEHYSSMFPSGDGNDYRFLIDFQDNYVEIYGVEAFSKETKYLDDIEKCISEHGTPDVNSAMLMQHTVRNASKADPKRVMRFCEMAVNQIVYVVNYGKDVEECIARSMPLISLLIKIKRLDLAKNISDSFNTYLMKRKAEIKPEEWLQISKLEVLIILIEVRVAIENGEHEKAVNKLSERSELHKQIYEVTKKEKYYFEYIVDTYLMADNCQKYDQDKAVSLFEKVLNSYSSIRDRMSDFPKSETKKKLLTAVDISKEQLKKLKKHDGSYGRGSSGVKSESWKGLKVERSIKSKVAIVKADVKNVCLISLNDEWEQTVKGILNYYFVNIISPEPNIDVSQYQMLCGTLSYVIVVIDHNFFEDGVAVNNVKYFVSKGLKVLPIVVERNLLSDYSNVFKRIEYVSAYDKETNKVIEAIDYYLKPVLTVLDTVEDRKNRANSSFAHKIFLSYRKKDREYANKLISEIYHLDNCWDTSIWFDDRLVVGEDYAKSIDDMLAGCDTVILLVTPSILEEKNYVKEVEYKKAIEYGKRIIPIEMADTDRASLEAAYDSLGSVYSVTDLKDVFAYINPGDINDTNHCLRIAEAFDKGINTSVNHEVAFKIYKDLAERGIFDSMVHVMDMYQKGIGTESDSDKAIFWCDKCINVLDKSVNKKDESSYEDYIVKLCSLVSIIAEESDDYLLELINRILEECKCYKDFFKLGSSKVDMVKMLFEKMLEEANNSDEKEQ